MGFWFFSLSLLMGIETFMNTSDKMLSISAGNQVSSKFEYLKA